MTARLAFALTTLVVLVSLAPSASAKPDAGVAGVDTSTVQVWNPLSCPVTVVADRPTRCDYLVARLAPTT